MAIAKGNAVTKPIMMVARTAFGTMRSGCRLSSARWRVASRPEYMNWGVVREVRKETPFGQPLDPLTNSVQMA